MGLKTEMNRLHLFAINGSTELTKAFNCYIQKRNWKGLKQEILLF